MASRGKGRGYGYTDPRQLRATISAAAGAGAGRLDAGQLRAVQHLTAGGDFLSVLTAPAGAGKTAEQTRRDSERAAREAHKLRTTPAPVPPEHRQAREVLERLQDQHRALLDRQGQLRTSIRDNERELSTASRWTRGRRRDLTTALADTTELLNATLPVVSRLEEQIRDASTVVDSQSRQRRTDDDARQRPSLPSLMAALRPDRDLADPRPADATAARNLADAARGAQPRLLGPEPRPRRQAPPGRSPGGLSR